MNQRISFIPVLATLFLWSSSAAMAGTIAFTGRVDGVSSLHPVWTVVVGTFDPSFDPWRYKFVYGDDAWGNMTSPNYNRAVADGVFRPFGSAGFRGAAFSGTVTGVSGIEGRQLWLFVFNHAEPDWASEFALCSGTGSGWTGPADAGSVDVLGGTATSFVFGMPGTGGSIRMQILPVPEPRTTWLCLVFAGALVWVTGRRARRSRAAGRVPLRGLPRNPTLGERWDH